MWACERHPGQAEDTQTHPPPHRVGGRRAGACRYGEQVCDGGRERKRHGAVCAPWREMHCPWRRKWQWGPSRCEWPTLLSQPMGTYKSALLPRAMSETEVMFQPGSALSVTSVTTRSPWSGQPPETMMVSVGHTTPTWMQVACTALWDQVGGVCGPGCLWGPCLGLWSYCSQRSCCCCQKSCGKPWFHALAHFKEQGSDFCNYSDDYRHTVEKKAHGRLLWQPLLP